MTEYAELLRSGPHIAFELTMEFITGIFGVIVGRVLLRRHDKRVHGKGH